MATLRRVRFRIGRWLLRPLLVRIAHHYEVTAEGAKDPDAKNACTYMAIGLRYAANGWGHGEDGLF